MHGLIFETSIWLLAGSTRYPIFHTDIFYVVVCFFHAWESVTRQLCELFKAKKQAADSLLPAEQNPCQPSHGYRSFVHRGFLLMLFSHTQERIRHWQLHGNRRPPREKLRPVAPPTDQVSSPWNIAKQLFYRPRTWVTSRLDSVTDSGSIQHGSICFSRRPRHLPTLCIPLVHAPTCLSDHQDVISDRWYQIHNTSFFPILSQTYSSYMQKSILFQKKRQNFVKVGLTVRTKFSCGSGTARVGWTALLSGQPGRLAGRTTRI